MSDACQQKRSLLAPKQTPYSASLGRGVAPGKQGLAITALATAFALLPRDSAGSATHAIVVLIVAAHGVELREQVARLHAAGGNTPRARHRNHRLK